MDMQDDEHAEDDLLEPLGPPMLGAALLIAAAEIVLICGAILLWKVLV